VGRLSRAAWLYMAAVLTAAAVLLACSIYLHRRLDLGVSQWVLILLVLAILFLVCDSRPTTLTSRQSGRGGGVIRIRRKRWEVE